MRPKEPPLPDPNNMILNSAFREPVNHWEYNQQEKRFQRAVGRREAGYWLSKPGSPEYDDPGEFRRLDLVNDIRRRVCAWRDEGYPGATGTTKHLLGHWNDSRLWGNQFFFCQIEAIETLIFLLEAPESRRAGMDIPSDGGPFQRLCSKMATGTGKTIVMGMLIAWHALNKNANRQDTRFSRDVLVIAPNITVRDRLQALKPRGEGSVYNDFPILPPEMHESINTARVHIRNWHALLWETEEKISNKRSVDKRGVLSKAAYAEKVLEDMASAKNILVVNDEAHHAWRPPEGRLPGVSKEEKDEATIWMKGLDRIHQARGILRCHDFSATPFIPGGKQAEDNLYSWIVSDFGLDEAIESGLVKIPRVVVRDDTLPDPKTYKSRLFHIYRDKTVQEDLNRKGATPQTSLPDLVRTAYTHLGQDWEQTFKAWRKEKRRKHPPVMITVVNRIETAARIEHAIESNILTPDALCNAESTLRIDSKIIEKEGAKAENLRKKLNTVGKPETDGAHIRHVIAVGMLSEGWDTRTVTHIMGLRAFTSQLLCEQVVGRGLRRAAYDSFETNGETFTPEYVNVFGVPFTFLKRTKQGGENGSGTEKIQNPNPTHA